jgi:hypothetical protein
LASRQLLCAVADGNAKDTTSPRMAALSFIDIPFIAVLL